MGCPEDDRDKATMLCAPWQRPCGGQGSSFSATSPLCGSLEPSLLNPDGLFPSDVSQGTMHPPRQALRHIRPTHNEQAQGPHSGHAQLCDSLTVCPRHMHNLSDLSHLGTPPSPRKKGVMPAPPCESCEDLGSTRYDVWCCPKPSGSP